MTTSRALVAARSTTKGTANSPFGGSGLDRVGLPRTRKTGLCPSQTWPTRDVQLKLAIGQTDDPLEREADRVADQVVRVPEPSTNRKLPAPNAGRACGDSYCACQHKSLGERRTRLAIPSLSPATAAPRTDVAPAHTAAAVMSTIATPGQPLGPDVRAALEGRIGHDLSPVRIHIDASAALSAHQLGAKAYTVGSHVAFAEGLYAPDTKPGMRLLAHEIAHIVQQEAVHQTGGGELQGDDGRTPLAGETLVQRDLAAPVPKPDAEAKDLSDAEIQDAIKYNTTRLTDPAEIAQVRDIIGAGPGAAIDEDFVRALVAFQAVSNIKEDGKLGPVTSSRLSREVRARGALPWAGRRQGSLPRGPPVGPGLVHDHDGQCCPRVDEHRKCRVRSPMGRAGQHGQWMDGATRALRWGKDGLCRQRRSDQHNRRRRVLGGLAGTSWSCFYWLECRCAPSRYLPDRRRGGEHERQADHHRARRLPAGLQPD